MSFKISIISSLITAQFSYTMVIEIPTLFFFVIFGIYVSFAAAVLLLVGLISFLIIYWDTRSSFKSGKALRLHTTYIVSKDGIRIETVQSNSLIKWDQLLSAVENKPMFILYISLRQAFIVPKRYFNSHEDIVSFKKIIMSEMDAKNLKLKKS